MKHAADPPAEPDQAARDGASGRHQSTRRPGERLLDLVTVMDRLRNECPWDQQQTHESLVRYLVEETYEVIEALESGDPLALREELGDLLLQVVFHARIASESGAFDIDDVATGIVDKLVSRHPHVFAGLEVADAAEVERNWTALKAREKARTSPIDGIPAGLPALSLAEKVATRLQAAGTDDVTLTLTLDELGGREDGSGGLDNLDGSDEETAESVGDALFAIAVRASRAGVDPEQALRRRVRQEMDIAQQASLRALPDGGDSPS